MELQDLKSLHQLGLDKFKPYYAAGAENARYVMGIHWTPEEIKQHEKEFLHAYSIPLFATKFQRILMEQRNERSKFRAKPRGSEDEIIAEIGNNVIDYVEDLNRFKYIESDIFEDGLGVMWGVIHGRIDISRDPLGEVIFEKVPYDEVMWDTNCTDYSIEKGATWFERFGWFTRDYIQDRIGVSKETLENIPQTTEGKKTDWVRKSKGKELIKVIWHYEKVYKTVYKVKNFSTDKYLRTKDKSVAEKFLADQKSLLRKELIGGAVGRPSKDIEDKIEKDFDFDTSKDAFWELTIFGEQSILKPPKNIGEKLPYVIYFSMIRDGTPYTLTSLIKDTQRAFDRRVSMIDRATCKNLSGSNYSIDPDLVHPAETKNIDELFKRLSKGGQYVRTKTSPSGKTAINPIDRVVDVRAEMDQLILLQSLIEDEMGGRTFQGLEAGHKQTATEAKLMEASAQKSTMLPRDNLIRWKELVGELMWYLIGQTYKEGRQFTIMGESLTAEVKELFGKANIYEQSEIDPATGWMTLTKELKPLSEAKVNIVIDAETDTKDSRERKAEFLMAMNQYFMQGGMPPMDGKVLTKYMNIDATTKQIVADYIETGKQQMAQAKLEAKEQQGIENLLGVASAIPETNKENSQRQP